MCAFLDFLSPVMHLVVRDIFNTLSHSICIMFLLFYDLHLFSAPWTEICKVDSKFLFYIMRQFLKGEARLLSFESQSGRLRLFQTLSVYECVSVSFYWCACFITLTLALNACLKCYALTPNMRFMFDSRWDKWSE